MPVDQTGITGKIYDTLHDVIELELRTSTELARMSQLVGKEGKINQRASIGGAGGAWQARIEHLNGLIADLSQTMSLDIEGRPLKGEFLRTAKVVNTMVEQLGSFASEVTRVAREVGTEGKLGGQAKVKGVAGTWKDLTDSVNSMASNLTAQVRNIA